MYCDSPAGYVCRINHTNSVELPEDVEDVASELLPILEATYKARIIMEAASRATKAKKTVIDVDEEEESFLPSFLPEGSKRKKRKSDASLL
ncbi:hypothetical protein BD560DRAFT_59636 [Blakeslea trispora]|nr:hypothetical protein BD560DRAFT_59629 [Blakeslea trispora]KAI8376946.1 hypothetical protein BD560DRAFT_59636 [Blakeslea trispora]